MLKAVRCARDPARRRGRRLGANLGPEAGADKKCAGETRPLKEDPGPDSPYEARKSCYRRGMSETPPGGLHTDSGRLGFIGMIRALSDAAGPSGMTIGEIRDRLDERSFGLMILVLAVPCLVPMLYGVPQIVGVPILLLAGQLLVGRDEPWLPGWMLRRTVSKAWLDRMADFAEKRMAWGERFSKPRLRPFAHGFGERFAAGFMILATLTIVMPMTNTVPSVALSLMSVGLIQRDGLFVLGGAAVAASWALALLALVAGLVLGAGWALGLVGGLGLSLG